MKIHLFLALLITSLPLFGASSCGVAKLRPDTGVSAVKAGDSTAIVEGCGNQPIAGYTYCRKMEGDATGEKLWFIAPPAECPGEDPCVSLRVYRKGDDPITLEFPRGVTRVGLLWTDLIDRDRFMTSDRGFWPFDYTIKWLDEDGREQFTFVDGEVRLVVYSMDYVPLHDAIDNPNFVWEWEEKGFQFKMTTGGRAAVFRSRSFE